MTRMRSTEITVRTGSTLVTDLTGRIERFCDGLGDGLVNVFVPHATAGDFVHLPAGVPLPELD